MSHTIVETLPSKLSSILQIRNGILYATTNYFMQIASVLVLQYFVNVYVICMVKYGAINSK